ncbi:glycosyltransferase family 2 protein [Tenacibaculum sp. nBUS_03]|uniref:glycosyltransferase family 2 protein n=1 Tax=Tenacibaculum sp. nBUS_03 TaxID=3395320 RepID=UPI003EB775B5
MYKVSIITPSYNSENFISETIKSVLNQTYSNWELIIVDDCSTDNTEQVIKEFSKKDERIKFFKNIKNSGAAVSRNVGLENSTGRFISFIDSDDLWNPTKLAEQIKFMIDNVIPISFTKYSLVDEYGVSLNQIINVVKELGYKDYMKNTIIGMSTSMIDTDLVSEFKFENIRTRQDTYLWITLLKRGHKAFGINKTLVSYRVRKDSISANKIKAARRVWYLYFNLEKLGFIKSSYYFSHYVFNALKKRL